MVSSSQIACSHGVIVGVCGSMFALIEYGGSLEVAGESLDQHSFESIARLQVVLQVSQPDVGVWERWC
jgi:hypothetical protein